MIDVLNVISDAMIFHEGTDLVERLNHVQKIIAWKNSALALALDEITRLRERVAELERAAPAGACNK